MRVDETVTQLNEKNYAQQEQMHFQIKLTVWPITTT